ncbi:MAG: MipA/OmpV family protein [Desulfosalsimonas sp.]
MLTTANLSTETRRLCLAGITVLICFLLAWPAQVQAGDEQQLPLWEIGLGAGAITMPAYRGSGVQEVYPVPVPYVVYRGDFIKVDREGIRGLLYDSPRLSIDLSADGAMPSTSREGDSRESMPDLDPVGEIGPSINYLLHKGEQSSIRLRLPVRTAFASDLTFIDHVGIKTHPQLNIGVRNFFAGWDLGAVIGPVFADDNYHSYYYGVSRKYATESRPAYRAEGGYSGTSVQVSAGRMFENIWVGMFARYDNLSGAVFEDSPLVETRHSFMGGIAAAWMLGRSSKTVPSSP